jgi:predicted PurR-regulated permease PerM
MLLIVILTVVGFGQFDTVLPALAVPAAFVLLNALEELVTPQIVGRRLALDPVMVFLARMLCGWLWGPAGLLLAMPLMTCLRIIAERIPDWSPLAKLLAS